MAIPFFSVASCRNIYSFPHRCYSLSISELPLILVDFTSNHEAYFFLVNCQNINIKLNDLPIFKKTPIYGLVKEAISFMTNNNNQVINHEYTSCVYSDSGKMTHAKCLPVLHIIDFPSDWNGSMDKLSLKCNDEANSLRHCSKMGIDRMSFRLVH